MLREKSLAAEPNLFGGTNDCAMVCSELRVWTFEKLEEQARLQDRFIRRFDSRTDARGGCAYSPGKIQVS